MNLKAIAWAAVAALFLFFVCKVKPSTLILCLTWLPGPLPFLSEAHMKAIKHVYSFKFWLPELSSHRLRRACI
jgi:hypothetical protein